MPAAPNNTSARSAGSAPASGSPLSPLSIAVLGLLSERPMHPYEMFQLLIERKEDRLVKIKPGTLYHAVARLEQQGLLAAQATGRAGNRPERTIYEVTAAGRTALSARLRELLATPAEEFPIFFQAVNEAHNLPAGEVVALLRQRRDLRAGELQWIRTEIDKARDHYPERYWLDATLQERLRSAELEWLDRIIADIDSGAVPWQ